MKKTSTRWELVLFWLNAWEPVSARIISAKFHSRQRNVTIIQCYAPTNMAEERVL